MPLGIGFEPAAGGVDRDVFADAGHHILEHAPLGCMIEHVVYRDQRHTGSCGDGCKPRKAAGIVTPIEHACREPRRFPFIETRE